MDDCFEACSVEEVEMAVGDEAADLENLVCFGVEACHLVVWVALVCIE